MAWKCYDCEHTNKGDNEAVCEACGTPFNFFADEAIKSRVIIKKLKTDLTKVEGKYKTYFEDATTKERQLEYLRQELHEANFQRGKFNSEKHSLDLQIRRLKEEITTLKTQLKSKDVAYSNLSYTNSTLLTTNSNLTNSNKALLERNKDLESKKSSLFSNGLNLIILGACVILSFFIGVYNFDYFITEIPKSNYNLIDSAAKVQPFVIKDVIFTNSANPNVSGKYFPKSMLRYIQPSLNIAPLATDGEYVVSWKIIDPEGMVINVIKGSNYTFVDTVSINVDTKHIELTGIGAEYPSFEPGNYRFETWVNGRHIGGASFKVTPH